MIRPEQAVIPSPIAAEWSRYRLREDIYYISGLPFSDYAHPLFSRVLHPVVFLDNATETTRDSRALKEMNTIEIRSADGKKGTLKQNYDCAVPVVGTTIARSILIVPLQFPPVFVARLLHALQRTYTQVCNQGHKRPEKNARRRPMFRSNGRRVLSRDQSVIWIGQSRKPTKSCLFAARKRFERVCLFRQIRC